jgi:hypothetical protein
MGVKLKKPSILVVNWVPSYLSFFLNASITITYIFSTLIYTIAIIFEPCALNAKFQYFILRLIKFHYFVDTTEREDRGWKGAQRKIEDRVTLRITLLCPHNSSTSHYN